MFSDILFSPISITLYQHVDAFVYAMALEESNAEKHDSIISLKLRPLEWDRTGLFLGLLAVCYSNDSINLYLTVLSLK